MVAGAPSFCVSVRPSFTDSKINRRGKNAIHNESGAVSI
jgi:hypothetical protein